MNKKVDFGYINAILSEIVLSYIKNFLDSPCIAGEAVVVGCNQFDVDRQEVSLFVVVAAKISCELILQLSPEAAAPGETVCAAAKIIWVGKNWEVVPVVEVVPWDWVELLVEKWGFPEGWQQPVICWCWGWWGSCCWFCRM